MMSCLKTLAVAAALAGSPALAAEADAHKDHHPGAPVAAAPADKPEGKGETGQMCAMMNGQMMGGQKMASPGEAKPGQQGGPVPAPGGMMDGKTMHCMQGAPAPAAAKPDAPHDHDHSGQ